MTNSNGTWKIAGVSAGFILLGMTVVLSGSETRERLAALEQRVSGVERRIDEYKIDTGERLKSIELKIDARGRQ